jgi:FAD/FMN-containing dehydrogenase
MTLAEPTALDQLRAEHDGRIVGPTDAGYDEARAVFPGGIDIRPAAIVRPRDAGDVARIVSLARDAGAPLSIRGGGHSIVGHGLVDDGIVIDTRGMTDIDIDLEDRAAWADTGLTAGEYTSAVGEHGLATGFGDAASVGIGGITLGGGIGFLSRLHGLTVDSLLAAEIVTADGEIREIDAERDPDLFWAIRGGGGNFGVATRFKFRLHEVPQVTGGMLMLPVTAEILDRFLAEAQAAPEALTTIANVMPAPPMPFVPEDVHGELVLMALVCHVGPADEGERALAPFRALATPIVDMAAPITYPEIYGPEPEDYHPSAVIRNVFAERIDAARVLERLATADAPMRVAQIRVLGGAIDRVSGDATAYPHRGAPIMASAVAFYEDADEQPARQAWVDEVGAEMGRPDGSGYVNFLGPETQETVRAAYPGETWERLRQIKRRYDPDNLFRSNQNIPPADAD